ncbi:hypothetical protein [Streptomyces sp. VB1]|uniref:hypothetical protein n=1 Tax=Streptomyces sp. VB1 TaxID=2986803 RepID=UPI002241E6CD|nr:hypothetical protein [Streptomyces sp. VB1]UZI29551.1 hypothetical protein OH133_16185 [Streptomyces sp. VB1]
MPKWVLDLGLAVLLSGVVAGALIVFWFVEGLKLWATKGGTVPGRTRRLILALSLGATSSALISYGLSEAEADLPVAHASQAVLAVLCAVLVILVAGDEGYERIATHRRRRRLRRERLRRHVTQPPGGSFRCRRDR